MSWNHKPATPSNVRTENKALKFEWTCPRCGRDQSVAITNEFTIGYGDQFDCNNIAVCGKGNSYIYYLGNKVFGNVSYISRSDVPLNKPFAA